MSFLRHIKKLILILLIPALCWVFYNHAANWHFHILPNGMIVEHAHPYDKHANPDSPFHNHNHTKSELLYLDIITHVLVVIVAAFFLSQIFRAFTQLSIPLRPLVRIPADYGQVKDSRAPPLRSC